MGLLALLGAIAALGYSSIDEYCNDKGLEICDVVDEEDDYYDNED